MNIDDILDELDDLESDASLAAAVSIGTRDIATISQDRLPSVCVELAKESSGYRCIPEALLTKELLIEGMRHMRAKDAEIHASEDYRENYQQAALIRLKNRELFLAAFHPALIDKRMILQTFETSSVGDNRQIKNFRAEAIDDEVGLASLKKSGMTDFFEHPAAVNFHESTWHAALSTDVKFLEPLMGHKLRATLGKLMSEGFWPSNLGWKKPADLSGAVAERVKIKDEGSTKAFVFNALIKSYPPEEVLPYLKSAARAKLRTQLYTAEDLRPYMKQFPFLKATVLENDLGM